MNGGIFTLIFPCKSRHRSEIPGISISSRFDNWEIPATGAFKKGCRKTRKQKACVFFPGLTWYRGDDATPF